MIYFSIGSKNEDIGTSNTFYISWNYIQYHIMDLQNKIDKKCSGVVFYNGGMVVEFSDDLVAIPFGVFLWWNSKFLINLFSMGNSN